MKQTLRSLLLLLLLPLASNAQELDNTFQFIDFYGNIVQDGSVITVSEVNYDGKIIIPLSVMNISGEKAAVAMFTNIDNMPNGSWQTCAFGNCMTLNESGYSSKNIVAADYEAEIETCWIPEEDYSASWKATLQIHLFNTVTKTTFGRTTVVAGDDIIGYGPTVTINFVPRLCGNGVTYYYEETTQTLTISKTEEGTGEMDDYNSLKNPLFYPLYTENATDFGDVLQHRGGLPFPVSITPHLFVF